jgi:hypothetical protein
MSHVKLSSFLGKIDYDKCFGIGSDSPQILLNQFATNVNKRNSVQSHCDNYNRKKNTSIFKDIANSVRQIEKEKINQQGDILTNKLEGTTSLSRKENSEMDDDIDQEGGGSRKRKNVRRKKTMHSTKRRKIQHNSKHKKSKVRKTKNSHKKKGKQVRKQHRRRRQRHIVPSSEKKRKSGKKSIHHFRRHNIFNSSD